jgi:predicted nucleotidyltransferase
VRGAAAEFDPAAILRTLLEHEVKFVVIGGVSGNLHGSTTPTEDIDVLYSRARPDLDRLARALTALEARLRGADPGLPFKPDAATLRNGLNFTFQTRLGPLDCLGEVAGGFTYDRVIGNAESYDIEGLKILAASLDDLIRMKRASGRPGDLKELENLSALREVRERRRR